MVLRHVVVQHSLRELVILMPGCDPVIEANAVSIISMSSLRAAPLRPGRRHIAPWSDTVSLSAAAKHPSRPRLIHRRDHQAGWSADTLCMSRAQQTRRRSILAQ